MLIRMRFRDFVLNFSVLCVSNKLHANKQLVKDLVLKWWVDVCSCVSNQVDEHEQHEQLA